MSHSVEHVLKILNQMGDPKIAAHSQRFFKTGKGEYAEGDQFLGIRVPVLRKLARDYRDISIDDASQILTSPFHEARLFALILLVNYYKRASIEEKKCIYESYLDNTQYINNWDLVDSSAEHIVGAYLDNQNKMPLYQLAKSTNMWERRIAMLSTFHYIKKYQFEDALNVCSQLLFDTEDLIHKAVGWMLREIGKRDIDKEEAFLKKYYRQMPRTMLRYAIEKFPEKKRIGYLKGEV
ncbi:MAG: DNA alkylation repair protein [Desulfobacterales bacterium]|nr:DNA alkylation repair protein [Desulfobacterales bacterium]